MHILAWDTETGLIQQGLPAPPITCVTWATPDGGCGILGHVDGCVMIEDALRRPAVRFVGAYVAYDFTVLTAERPDLFPLIYEAYDSDRVTCVKIRQQLLDIAAGRFRGGPNADGVWVKWGYSLEDLARRFLGVQMQKDTWRLEYSAFRGVPIDYWTTHARTVRPDLKPEECITYPIDDAVNTLKVWECQELANTKIIDGVQTDWLYDQFAQTRASFWLSLMSARGVRTDLAKVEDLERATVEAYQKVATVLAEKGLIKWNKAKNDWSRNTKAAAQYMVAACKENGVPIRRTKTGERRAKDEPDLVLADDQYVCLDEDACKASEDALMIEYAELTTLKKVLNNDVKMLREGTYYPIHSRFDMVLTGRVSSSKPNLTNIRRLPGIRECFIPREGYVFLENDYPSVELYTLAEVCALRVGFSTLGVVLREGRDPHTELAARILNIDIATATVRAKDKRDKIFDDARQTAKVANFGFPGGLGIRTFVYFARKTYGVILSEDQARTLKEIWFETWPEMREYFNYVKSLFWQTGVEKPYCNVEQLHVRRWRGGCTFCNGCNTGFQALAADIGKRAGWRLTGECWGTRGDYEGGSSPLLGGRIVNFIHDQFFLEFPICHAQRMHDAAMRLGEVMRVEANKLLTTVPIRVEKIKPTILRYWSKEAEQVFDNGVLQPWPRLPALDM